MKVYFAVGAFAAILMFTVIGGYRLLFESKDNTAIEVSNSGNENYEPYSAAEHNRRFTALVCDNLTENEPYLVKVAFCSVIINRCNSGYFPSTPEEVIFSDQRFSDCYLIDFTKEPTTQSLNAYDDALKGYSPCTNALYCIKTHETDSILMRRRVVFKFGQYVFS